MAFDLARSIDGSVVHFGFLSASKVAVQALHLVTLAWITRELGPEMYGKMSVVVMAAQFVFFMTCSWSAVGYTRYATISGPEGGALSAVFWSRTVLVFGLIGLAVAGAMLGRSPILAYLDLPPPVLAVAFFHLLSLVWTNYLRQMAQVTSEFKKLSVAQVIEKALTLGLVVIWGNGVISILWILSATTVGCQTFLAFLFKRSLFFPIRFRRELFLEMIRFSYPFLLTSLGGFLFGWVDVAVIKQFASMDRVGVYSLAYSGLGAVEAVVFFMPTILTPIFVSLVHQRRHEEMKRFVRRVVPQIFYLWGWGILVIGCLALWVIPGAFGEGFADSTSVFLVLLVALYLAVFNALCVPVFVAYSIVKNMVVITFSASIVNLLLDLALVPIAGIMGAAFATLCSYACISAAYGALIRGRFSLGIEKITVFLGISILHIAGLLVFRNPVAVVAITLAAGGAFFVAGKSMSVFSAEDQGIYESLRMPVFAKRALLRICGYHG